MNTTLLIIGLLALNVITHVIAWTVGWCSGTFGLAKRLQPHLDARQRKLLVDLLHDSRHEQ